MSAPGPTRLRNAEQSAIADQKIAAALDRMRQAGTPITKSGLAREAGVNVKAVERRWAAISGEAPAVPRQAPAPRRFTRKPPPPRQPPPMEKARLAGLLTAACDPTSTDADVLIAARAAGRLLARIGMSVDAVLLHQPTDAAMDDRADARRIRSRAAAVMQAAAFDLLTSWQKGFVFSLSEWTASVSQKQREILAEIEAKVAAAEAAGGAVDALAHGRRP